MAKTMCPLCGAKTHANTGNPAGYERLYPELMIVGYACRLCPQCAGEIAEGDAVEIRGEDKHLAGRVIRVAECAGGHKLYRVEFPDGMKATFPRSKLGKAPTR